MKYLWSLETFTLKLQMSLTFFINKGKGWCSQEEDCCTYVTCSSELVTRQEARKQDSELGLGAQKNTRVQPVKN
jgi:hypothetical protein